MNRDELVLRDARGQDFDVIASWVPDARACLRWAGPNVSFPFTEGSLEKELLVADRQSRCLVHPEATEVPLAFGQSWTREVGARHLGRVLVDPSHRGFGLGHALVTRLVDEARADPGIAWITLRVFADNLPALSVYRQAGFIDVPSLREGDALFMRRPARTARDG